MQNRDHLPSKYARLSWSLVVQVVIFPHLSGEGCQILRQLSRLILRLILCVIRGTSTASAIDCSVPRQARTASTGSECSPPELISVPRRTSTALRIRVFPAGPQPQRISEDILDRMPERMSEDMPDRMAERMPDRIPEGMSEQMPDRMPEIMSAYMHVYARKNDFQMVCQKLCQNNGSGCKSLAESNFVLQPTPCS